MTILKESFIAYSHKVDIVGEKKKKPWNFVVEAVECITMELIVSPRIHVKWEHWLAQNGPETWNGDIQGTHKKLITLNLQVTQSLANGGWHLAS